MDNVKNDMYYSKKIRDNMVFLVKHTKGLSQKEIENNEILLDSIMFRLI